MRYQYDGTYIGFLTTVFEIYYRGIASLEDITKENAEASLFGNDIVVTSTMEKAERVAQGFEKACGSRAMRWMYRAFLSDEPGMEMKIFTFLYRGFQLKKQIYACQREAWVQDILEMCRAVGNEAEKLRGILRFSELEEGMLFAECAPTHNVLPILAVHFRERLSSERWAIYDARRHRAAVYEEGKVSLVWVEKKENPLYSEREMDFRRLWREYYRHMAIEERRNPKLRRQFLPKKYWAYLTEMQDPANRQDVKMR